MTPDSRELGEAHLMAQANCVSTEWIVRTPVLQFLDKRSA